MCLTTIMDDPLTAEEDISCYKVMKQKPNGSIYSMFYPLKWKLGKLKRIPIKTIIKKRDASVFGFYIYHNGFHSYSNINYWFIRSMTKNPKNNIEELVIVECIIPKGSKYYHAEGIVKMKNEHYVYRERAEYVSNQLIPIKIIKDH